jgi:hypothetical protein
VHAGREGFLFDLVELALDFLDDGGGVRAGTLLENDGRRGMTVDVRVNVEELRAQLDLGLAFKMMFLYCSGLLNRPM